MGPLESIFCCCFCPRPQSLGMGIFEDIDLWESVTGILKKIKNSYSFRLTLQLKREIMKELKIKEGAENLLKLTKKDKREVEKMIKQSNNKLDALNHDLQEVNNYLVIAGDGSSSRASRRASMPHLGKRVFFNLIGWVLETYRNILD